MAHFTRSRAIRDAGTCMSREADVEPDDVPPACCWYYRIFREIARYGREGTPVRVDRTGRARVRSFWGWTRNFGVCWSPHCRNHPERFQRLHRPFCCWKFRDAVESSLRQGRSSRRRHCRGLCGARRKHQKHCRKG